MAAQAGQAAPVAAAGQVQQQGFGPVAGGVTGHHVTGPQGPGPGLQLAIAPVAGHGFAGRAPFAAAVNHQAQALLQAPGCKFLGLAGRFGPPAVIAVPEQQRPVVQPAQVEQQGQQGHRVLAAGHRQQQGRPRRQQAGVAQQVPVQP